MHKTFISDLPKLFQQLELSSTKQVINYCSEGGAQLQGLIFIFAWNLVLMTTNYISIYKMSEILWNLACFECFNGLELDICCSHSLWGHFPNKKQNLSAGNISKEKLTDDYLFFSLVYTGVHLVYQP